MAYSIEVNNLVKKYDSFTAVDNISFNIDKGEVFSLLGPNGAGKTTTVEIIEGLRVPTSGSVKLLGMDPIKDREVLSKKIGVLPQDFRFIENVTPKEAIDYYKTTMESKADWKALLELVDLYEKRNNVYKNLSGGEKQKMGLALSLVNDPEVLFVDEPTTGLDPRARRGIWKVIEQLKKQGKSILLTTHYLEEAEILADKVAIISHGKIIVKGKPSEIVQTYYKGDIIRIKTKSNLDELLKIKGIKYEKNEDTYQISASNTKEIFSILDVLKESNIEMQDLTIKRESLEDIFVRLVGQKEDEDES
jgi:ABC-2 type transport system ATP-binding protein